MEEQQPAHHERYINLFIVFFFIAALLCGTAGGMLKTESKVQMSLYQFSSAFFIAGCTICGAKLIHEGWDISGGRLYNIGYFTGSVLRILIGSPGGASCFFFVWNPSFLPGMILIFFYKLFPLWVRILGLASCIPFLLILIFTSLNYEDKNLLILFILSFTLIDITALLWAFYFWRNYRKNIE